MPMQLRRGTDAERLLIILDAGEMGYTTDTEQLYLGNGQGLGGNLIGETRLIVTLDSGESLGGNRIVMSKAEKAFYASSDTIIDSQVVVGITRNSSLLDSKVQIQVSGEMVEPTWTWSIGALYLGLNGNMTQTPPNSGLLLQIGNAISPTRIIININQSIKRI